MHLQSLNRILINQSFALLSRKHLSEAIAPQPPLSSVDHEENKYKVCMQHTRIEIEIPEVAMLKQKSIES